MVSPGILILIMYHDGITWYPGAASGLTAAPFSPANAELLRPAPYKIIPMIFFSSIYHFCFQFIHLQDPLPSRPLPLPAAQAEPQGSLSSGPSGGPWPSPSWAPPSLWPPRPSSPQSLGIPITHQPHPSPPHCSETDQECESSEKEMFGKEKICNKMMEILSPSPHHWMQCQGKIAAKIARFHFSKVFPSLPPSLHPPPALVCKAPKTGTHFKMVIHRHLFIHIYIYVLVFQSKFGFRKSNYASMYVSSTPWEDSSLWGLFSELVGSQNMKVESSEISSNQWNWWVLN